MTSNSTCRYLIAVPTEVKPCGCKSAFETYKLVLSTLRANLPYDSFCQWLDEFLDPAFQFGIIFDPGLFQPHSCCLEKERRYTGYSQLVTPHQLLKAL